MWMLSVRSTVSRNVSSFDSKKRDNLSIRVIFEERIGDQMTLGKWENACCQPAIRSDSVRFDISIWLWPQDWLYGSHVVRTSVSASKVPIPATIFQMEKVLALTNDCIHYSMLSAFSSAARKCVDILICLKCVFCVTVQFPPCKPIAQHPIRTSLLYGSTLWCR